jgi:hypothetical protein
VAGALTTDEEGNKTRPDQRGDDTIPEGISHIQYADDIPALNGYLD